jgi:hypothetical protein
MDIYALAGFAAFSSKIAPLKVSYGSFVQEILCHITVGSFREEDEVIVKSVTHGEERLAANR